MQKKLAFTKNGIKSNLSVYQKRISQTKKFKKWFDSSIVRDLFQEPMVLRHGSHKKFDQFKKSPQGIFFCDFERAVTYAKSRFEQTYGWKKSKNQWIFFYECFLQIQKPFYLNREKYRDIKCEDIWKQWYDWIIAYKTRDSEWTYDQYIVKNPNQIWLINSYW